MDRTAEFRRLLEKAGGAAPAPEAPAPSAFSRSASELREQLELLRRGLRDDSVEASHIQACQQKVERLEASVGDLGELGPRAPRQTQDLLAHRRGVVAALYEELRELASRVQASQVRELRHEAEVAGFFTAAPRQAFVPKPPPRLEVPEGDGSAARVPASALRAEEQHLLQAFQTDLDKIQETQQKIEEVSALVGMFATKVVEQQEQAEHIHAIAEESTAYIEKAEKHLHQAAKNSDSYRFYVVCWFVGSALFLLVYDYIDSCFWI